MPTPLKHRIIINRMAQEGPKRELAKATVRTQVWSNQPPIELGTEAYLLGWRDAARMIHDLLTAEVRLDTAERSIALSMEEDPS